MILFIKNSKGEIDMNKTNEIQELLIKIKEIAGNIPNPNRKAKNDVTIFNSIQRYLKCEINSNERNNKLITLTSKNPIYSSQLIKSFEIIFNSEVTDFSMEVLIKREERGNENINAFYIIHSSIGEHQTVKKFFYEKVFLGIILYIYNRMKFNGFIEDDFQLIFPSQTIVSNLESLLASNGFYLKCKKEVITQYDVLVNDKKLVKTEREELRKQHLLIEYLNSRNGVFASSQHISERKIRCLMNLNFSIRKMDIV